MCFATWIGKVDSLLFRLVGLTVADIPKSLSLADLFTAGKNPKMAVKEAIFYYCVANRVKFTAKE